MWKIIQFSKFVDLFVFYFIIQLGVIQAQSNRLFINEYMASNNQTITDEGANYDDWIEIYNDGEDSANVKGFFLTDNFNDPTKWAFPDTSIPPKGFLIIWADTDTVQGKLHANFKLSANGEQIGIFDGNNYIDSLTFAQQKTDVSYGRYPDASFNWYFYIESTPGTSNNPPSKQFAPNPVFSPPGGFFHDSVDVEILLNLPTAKVHYTLDCSDPMESSSIYSMPIKVSKTTVIRAKAYEVGYLPSEIVTHSYIVDKDFDIATLSLVTDPPNLWDKDSGIYVNPNNKGDTWERPVSAELFDSSDQLCFSVNAGIRISGEYSRDYEKKAFRLYFRNEYGLNWLEYPLFHAKSQVDRFKRLLVHAGSTDMPANPFGYGWTLLRDPLMHELGHRVGCIYPANHPMAVFLNGEPWGIYNVMERIDKYFTESNFDKLDVDLIENNTGARDGDMTEWNKLIDFFESHDLYLETNYEQAKSFIDIQNFTNYHILEIFGANGDWTHHNVFSYRPRRDGAVWCWILWDMDGCFGSYGVNHNTLEFATRDDPATIILRKLLENQNYRNLFINRFADLLNSKFTYGQVNYLIDSLANVIRNDISFETEKWGSSPNSWEQDGIDGQLRDFAQNRPDIVRSHIQDQFKIDGKVALTIKPPLAGKGNIRINSIIADSFPWYGVYFKNVPIELEAIPGPRYLFKKWSDSTLPQDPKISIALTEDFNIAAEFELDSPEVYLIINEINYNSTSDFDPGDWIELYNPDSDIVNLSDWCFKDDDETHKFLFPENIKIEPYGYLVLCQNHAAFHSLLPEVLHYIGDFNFGLGADGDEVRIYNACSFLIDSVKFDDSPPWQTRPDGNGPTLELIDPNLDNNLAENWQTSIGNGTPGKQNSKPGSSIYPEARRPEIPLKNYLFQNYPNPFSSGTHIKYDIYIPARIQIIIYNLLGVEIAIIADQYQSGGSYELNWDGKDKHGRSVPSGIFLYQIKTGTFIQMRKMVIIR